jgi:hypothetical protein
MSESATPADDTAARVRQALLDNIHSQAVRAPNATALLRLAEAYAWTVAPDQPHRGGGEE